MMKSILQHLGNGLQESAPVSMYHFNFVDRYQTAVSATNLPLSRLYGICHGAEIPHIFHLALNNLELAYPNAPEMRISMELVNQLINFAYEGKLITKNLTCTTCNGQNSTVDFLEFTNGPNNVVQVNLLGPASDQVAYLNDTYSWWTTVAQQSN
ncbi:uncharacterized protein LOC129747210 [Uranotaenia lowii]|uniref:uncharacterized protein LOC129747210 n=1 Tax=Uranotaenia lowii TaxID=190385 RepID=UPI002478DB88|nr:uncharacterized protein LOC129747210 [Uranotaenia lowii]